MDILPIASGFPLKTNTINRCKASYTIKTKKAGLIGQTDEGYRFRYDSEYLADPGAKPVSHTLPLTSDPYSNKAMFPFFDGLIPEGCWMWPSNLENKSSFIYVLLSFLTNKL